jgi:hypothetical protein
MKLAYLVHDVYILCFRANLIRIKYSYNSLLRRHATGKKNYCLPSNLLTIWV